MTGSQYKNVAQWTLANTPGVEAMDSADTARAIFNNLGVAFPNGSCEEILLTLMSEDYMGWTPCTYRQAQEYANAGVAAVGVDTSRVVVILPDESADGVIASADAAVVSASAKQTSDIAATERIGMQFYAYGSGTNTGSGSGGSTTTVTPQMTHRLLTCYQTKNECYLNGESIGVPKGIVVHSTGVNNPFLKRYVDYPEEVGVNSNGNHWNQSGIDTMVHAFIGLDKNNNVAIVNTLPYTYACWGVGSGSKGSYNYSPNGHIQFEICEDGLDDFAYFNDAVFGAAVEYCAYLCRRFSFSVNSIVSHKETHALGYGSNHGDPENWLTNFEKTMNDFRTAVEAQL